MLTGKTNICLFLLLFTSLWTLAQTPVTGITTSTQTATSSSYTTGGTTYNWGQSTDVYLDSIEISGTRYGIGADVYGKNIQLKRVDNTNASGERCQVFVERSSSTSLDATYPVDENGDCSMITAMSEPIINRGALDVFHNIDDGGVEYANNIERVDMLTTGLVAPATALLDELGFLVTEKRGNNDFKAAAILSVDVNGEPASYGTLITINGSPDYGVLGASYNFRFFRDASSAPHGLPEPFYNSSEQIGFSLITFDDLGLTAGQKIYGISFFGSDVISGTHTLTDPSTFPDNTNEGADIHGALGSIYHTPNIILEDLIDTDGDGIVDGDDIDDDNDGIIDTDECYSYGPELVVNGDFEDAYANWTSDFSRGRNNFAATAGGCGNMGWVAVSPCASNNGNCNTYYNYNGSTPTGTTLITDPYGTGANVLPTTTCNTTAGACLAASLPDHTSGTGLSVYVDPNDIVGESYWMQTVSVEANKTYRFSAWIMVIEEDPNLEFKINGVSLTGGINLDRLTGGSNGPDEWQEVVGYWSSGAVSGNVLLELANLTAGCGGNDIRMDDISLRAIITCDADNDGIADHLDLDSDNDGIPDLIEAGGVDTDGNGLVDDATDTDEDGLANTFETADGSTSILLDTDGDGTNDLNHDNDGDGLANWIDLDADGDGILDIIEAGGTDADGDGIGDDATDADKDGYFDIYDPNASDGPGGTGTNGTAHMTSSSDGGDSDSRSEYTASSGIADSDGDDVPDFLDVDSDNDGIYDIYEAQATVGYTPPTGNDDDSDGIDNAYDDDDSNFGGAGAAGIAPVNTDSGSGDAVPDYLDTDSDADNSSDRQEAWDALGGDGLPDGVSGSCDTDSDGDGLVDCFDSNDSDASVWTAAVTPPNDDGTGGSTISTGINISASNDVSGIFPNNAGGSSLTEPDWRDDGISPFPVEWLGFTATQQGNDALLAWSTASELNADYFAIERSSDGDVFQQIGREKASGTTAETSTYQFVDPQITQLPSDQFYYRIRQVDVDGSYAYSSVQELRLTDKAVKLWLRARPSPVSRVLSIDFRITGTSSPELEVISSMGQLVYAQSLNQQEGSIEISVVNWAEGVYYISMYGEDVREMYKIVVKH